MDHADLEFCDGLSFDAVRRHASLAALADAPRTKRDLASAVGVSGTTAQRTLASFKDGGLVEHTPEGHVLTGHGRTVLNAVRRYHADVAAAVRLEPLTDSIDVHDVEFDLEAFADASLTVAEPGDPYGPLRRFADLLETTESLRGFDTTSVAPTYVEEVHEKILGGTPVEIVYDPAVVESIASDYADLAAEAFEQDSLSIWVHDEVPFGLALFDDRVGVGGYDDETGLLEVFVDSDDPAAIEWGEALFECHRDEATPL